MKRNQGFTLMELLIVIGVLGILAAGLLAAIDPFEQLKKARDANNRSAAIEVLSSFTRYFANHGQFPWNVTAPITACSKAVGGGLVGLDTLSGGVLEIQSFKDCMDNTLVTDGELKTTFFDGIGSVNYYISSATADKTNLTVCFSPEGKSLRSDAKTSYLLSGTGPYTIVDQSTLAEAAVCPDVTNANCLQCFK
jgi:prepilin-type N-terminal cleavage/methylation domain-containing protein